MGKEKNIEKKGWDLLAIATIPLIMTLGNSMLIPILPLMESEMNITKFQSSMIITMYSIAAVLFIPLAGFLSDRIGRKKVMIPSLVISALGGIVIWLTASMWNGHYGWMLTGRFIQGLGAAGAFPIVIPLVGDLFEKDAQVSRGLGVIETSNTLGKVLSPVAGALLALIVWYAPFYVYPLLCLLSIILVWLLLKVPTHEEEPLTLIAYLQRLKRIFVQHRQWIYGIFSLGLLSLYLIFGTLFYLSSILEDPHQIDGWLKGVFMAIPLGALSLASFLTGYWVGTKRMLMKWLIVCGGCLMTVSLFFLAFSKTLFMIMFLFSLMSVGIGVILPCMDALITAGIEKEERGMLTGIYNSMRYIGVALGPPAFSLMLKYAEGWLFYVHTGIGGMLIIVAVFALRPQSKTVKTVFRRLQRG